MSKCRSWDIVSIVWYKQTSLLRIHQKIHAQGIAQRTSIDHGQNLETDTSSYGYAKDLQRITSRDGVARHPHRTRPTL